MIPVNSGQGCGARSKAVGSAWLFAGIALCIAVVGCFDTPRDYEQEAAQAEMEIDQLVAVIEVLTERDQGSCAVRNNGPRVICVMIDGAVKHQELYPSEYVAIRGPR
jgi:hypothetical protein